MKYLFKKLSALIITLLAISFVTFLSFEVIPGDNALVALGKDASPAEVEALREARGLNRPLPTRYFNWLGRTLQGDLGDSLSYAMPVKRLVGGRLSVTMGLGLLALLLIAACSIPLGILAAKKEGGIWDRLFLFINQIGMSIPPFFMGILITLLFGMGLRLFEPGAYTPLKESVGGYLKYMIFPAVAVAIPKVSMMVKFLRSSILREKSRDYVRTARSKGNTENRILCRHILKNAMIPVVTFFGMIAADVLAGSMITEQVFNLPGMGRLLVVSISNRDFPVVQAIVLYMAALVLTINFLVDLAYRYLDPRTEM